MTLLAMLGSMSGLVSGIGTGFTAAGTLATQALQAVSQFFNDYIVQPLMDFWEWIKGAWKSFEGWASDAWTATGEFLDEYLIQPLETFWGWMEEGWQLYQDWASFCWNLVFQLMNDLFISPLKTFWGWIEGAWESFTGWGSDAWSTISSVYTNLFTNPIDTYWNLLETMWETLSGWGEGAWKFIGDVFDTLYVTPMMVFWNLLNTMWSNLAGWGESTWESVGDAWDTYVGNPISDFFAWMDNTWDSITTGISSAWNALDFGISLEGGWNFIMDLIDDPIGMFLDIGNAVTNWASGLGETIASLLKSPINGIIGLINSFFDSIDFSIGLENPFTGTEYSIGFDLSGWNIPQLAKGGIVDKPTLAMIGEDGPEAVIPLSQRNNPQGVGMNGGTFNITVNASGITDRTDKRSLAREIGNMIQQEMARNIGGATMRGRY